MPIFVTKRFDSNLFKMNRWIDLNRESGAYSTKFTYVCHIQSLRSVDHNGLLCCQPHCFLFHQLADVSPERPGIKLLLHNATDTRDNTSIHRTYDWWTRGSTGDREKEIERGAYHTRSWKVALYCLPRTLQATFNTLIISTVCVCSSQLNILSSADGNDYSHHRRHLHFRQPT